MTIMQIDKMNKGLSVAPSEMNKTNKYNTGDIVTGIVTAKIEDIIKVKFDNDEIVIKNDTRIKEQVNDEIKFEVETSENKNIKLKYIKQEAKLVNNNNTINSTDIKDIKNIKDKMNKEAVNITEENIEIVKQNDSKIKDIKNQINIIVNKGTEQSAKTLSDRGHNIDEMPTDLLARIIETEDNIQTITLTDEQIDQISKELTQENTTNIDNKIDVQKAIQALIKQGISVTHKNIQQVIGLNSKLQKIKNLDPKAIENIIRNDWDLSIEKIYKALYSAGASNNTSTWEENQSPYNNVGITDPQTHRSQITNQQTIEYLKQQKIEIKEETVQAAKFLIDRDLPVTKTNIQKVIDLKSIDQIIDKNYEDIIKQLKEDKGLSQIKLVPETTEKLNENQLKEVIDYIPKITDDQIKKVLAQNKLLNINNLKEVENKTEPKQVESKEINIENKELITAKRQVEEIRLKLTIEAANKLNLKNIKIDTAPLKQIVDGLKQIEKEMDAKQPQTIKEISEAIEGLKHTPATTLGQVITKKIDFTIESINNQAVQDYDKLSTKIDRSLGDSFNKISDQIEPLLKQLNMEINKQNIRSAGILIKNEINVTTDNIEHITLLDDKVNHVIDRLHPQVAASMLKEGLNPLNMHIDQVKQYIQSFDDLYGQTSKDQIAKNIMEMDENKQLTPSERKGITALYRIFNIVSKSKGKAVGFLMKNNMKLTVENLLETSKYLTRTGAKNKDIDVNINDEFGTVKNIEINESNIRNQIKQALEESNMAPTKDNLQRANELKSNNIEIEPNNLIKNSLMEQTLEQAFIKLSPTTITNLKEIEPNFNQIPLEKLLQQVNEKQSNRGETIKQTLNEIKELQNIDNATLNIVEKYEIEPTISNLKTIKQMLDDPFHFGKQLENMDTLLANDESLTFKHNYENVFQQLQQGKPIKEILQEVKNNSNNIQEQLINLKSINKKEIIKKSKDIKKILDIKDKIRNSEEIYQIPVVLQDKVTHINLYIQKNNMNQQSNDKNEINAFISMQTQNLGIVQASMKITDIEVQVEIQNENKENVEYIQKYNKQFKEVIKNIGMSVKNMTYKESKPANQLKQLGQPKQSNQVLKYKESKIEVTI